MPTLSHLLTLLAFLYILILNQTCHKKATVLQYHATMVDVSLNERASNLIVSIGNFTHNANCPRVRDAQSGVGEYKRGVAWPEGSAPRTGGRFKLLLAQLHTLSKTHSTRQLQHFSTVSTTVTRETHRK